MRPTPRTVCRECGPIFPLPARPTEVRGQIAKPEVPGRPLARRDRERTVSRDDRKPSPSVPTGFTFGR